MTPLKTVAALALVALLAACTGADTMAYLPVDAEGLAQIDTRPVAPLY